MRNLQLLIVLAVATAPFPSVVAAAPLPPNSIARSQPPAVWRTDFHSAESEARRLGLPLLVHFSAEWCGPCQRMEQEVLHSPALYRQLEGRFIAVKIDTDRNPDLVQRFGIDSLPSDLFLGVDGTVLARSSAAQDLQSYLARIAHVESRVVQSRKVQIAGGVAPKDSHQASVGAGGIGPRLDPNPPSSAAGSGAPPASRGVDKAVPVKRPNWALGLRGFSPVTLSKQRGWVKGDPRFASEHKGIVYHLTSAAELAEFEASPDRYAPQLQGCDPVILEERDRAVVGDTRYGVFYNGELYFFVNMETSSRFKASPQRYTRTKHVLNLDKIEPTETL